MSEDIEAAARYYRTGHLQQAEQLYKQVLQFAPNHPVALHSLGVIAHQNGRHDTAVELTGKAIASAPQIPQFHNTLGVALNALGRFDEAIAAYQQALKLTPDYADAHYNMGNSLASLGRYAAAVEQYNQALLVKPDDAYTYFNMGVTLQKLGRHADAIESFSTVIQLNHDPTEAYKAMAASQQLLGRHTKAINSFRQALRFKPDCAQSHRDLGSLLLQTGNFTQGWRKKLTGPDFKVGIVWGSRFRLDESDGNRGREAGYFTRLTAIPGVSLYGLQKGPTANQIRDFSDEITITNLGDEFEDFTDTAAAIENLDLIISVDTSVLHLAGAMGKPTWALLRFEGNWRWLLDRQDSPWYPTMKLFRQKKPGHWPDVFERVAEELQKLTSRKGYCVKTQNTSRN